MVYGITMVYGRYIELVFMGIIMVYKPTYNWMVDTPMTEATYNRFSYKSWGFMVNGC